MKPFALLLIAIAAVLPACALAWGYEGHQVIALIARSRLTPAVRAKVDGLLATDADSLTAHDMASEATWADAYRGAGHRETASWHFVDTELDHPDLAQACFGFPASSTGAASSGPAQDCVVDKVAEFTTELRDPATSAPERLLALKFLLHFVGDLHQPLHASDNHDRGGNCVPVTLGGSRTTNLHAWWDTSVVQLLGSDAPTIAAQLEAQVTPALASRWAQGDPKGWALESYGVAKASVCTLNTPSGCGRDAAPVALPDAYVAAAVQLERAGVRLAACSIARSGERCGDHEADRWRLVSAALAAVCTFPSLLPWTTSGRLHATERRVLHAWDGCPLTREDVEHS